MRILHTSDWHLGRSFHREDLLGHQAAFVDHLLEVVDAEEVDVVVVAGDVYDRALPHVDAVALADETFARLREHFDEPEIVELCMNVALFVGFGRMGAVLHMVDDLPDRFQADGRVTPWGDGDVVLIPDRAPAG